jgi:TrmH family RNA methyltransferase
MFTERRRKEIAALRQKKYRDRAGELLVEGVRSVEAAVAAGASLVEVVVAEPVAEEGRVRAVAAAAGVPVHVVPERTLARLSVVQTSQGVLAVARIEPEDEAALVQKRAVLVLDGVQDPGNVGTILRTAAWFGVEAVVAGAGTADLYSPKVVRATMGALWDLRLVRSADTPAVLARLKEAGFMLYGADLEGTPARAWAPPRPSALVLGSEAHGLGPVLRRHLDGCVTIAGPGGSPGTESLNVAVAAGILVYQWMSGP